MKSSAFGSPFAAVLLVAIALPRECRSQQDTVSLQQAIQEAETKNLAVAIARAEERKSSAREDELRSGRLPPLFFRTHYLYAPDHGYNATVTNGGEYGVQFATGIPLYDGGARGAAIDQALTDVERSGINVQRATVELGFAARSACYELARATNDADIRQESVTRLQDYTRLLVQMQGGGLAGQSDVLKARVDLNNALIALDASHRALQDARARLNEVLGRPADRPVFVSSLPSPDTSVPPPDSLEHNLDLQLLRHDQASAQFELTIAEAERLPTLGFVADAGALGITPSEFRHDLGYSFLLTLDLPVFTWGGVNQRIEQKQLAVQSLDIQVALQRRELETQMLLARQDLALARTALARVAGNRIDAEQNYLLAKARFAGGSGTNLDVLDAHRLLVQAETDENDALFHYRMAEASLLRLNGQP